MAELPTLDKRGLRRTVVRDQLGVHFVCFVAEQFALGIVVDARRIHDADRVPGLMQVQGQCFPIPASSFQTGMQPLYTMFAQPFVQLSETLGLVAELAIILFVFLQQCYLERVFGDGDTLDRKSDWLTSECVIESIGLGKLARQVILVNSSSHLVG